MANSTHRQNIWNLYLYGKSITEVVSETGYSVKEVSKNFLEFKVAQVRVESNREEEMIQIRAIEQELFDSIKRFHKNPTGELNNKIVQLQDTYCRICF